MVENTSFPLMEVGRCVEMMDFEAVCDEMGG